MPNGTALWASTAKERLMTAPTRNWSWTVLTIQRIPLAGLRQCAADPRRSQGGRELADSRGVAYLPAARAAGWQGVGDEGDRVQATSAGRTRYRPRAKRNILCVSPAYAPSFGTF